MNALVLLLALTSTLVLRTGEKIVAEGMPSEENGVITFRAGGVLYSMPAVEIVRIDKNDASGDDGSQVRKLRVSPEERKRLIEELEKNHRGTAPAALPATIKVPQAPRPNPGDEQRWRQQARDHEEAVRRAREEVALLEARAEELRSEIRSFVSLGFKPDQFTYQTSRLQFTIDLLPRARLEVARAERAYEQFREDARKQGIMPGWLR
jgi:hypothetical protein